MLARLVEDDIALLVDQQNIPLFKRGGVPKYLIQKLRLHINHDGSDILERIIILNHPGLDQNRLPRGGAAIFARADPNGSAFGRFHRLIPVLFAERIE
ncbi:hypothetical protein D1872_232410 [compost metagenome]